MNEYKMAENSKGGILNKADKFLRRRKTKVLQSLGKTGRTTDDKLAEDCLLLEKQLEVGNKLQKDLKTYLHSAKALSVAAKTLYTTVGETYEPEWDDHEAVSEALKNMDMLWQDYLQKLHEQVQEPLVKYLAIIPQIKARVSKQSRKLIDYDNARHNLEVLQNAKKKDNAKIAKAQEELDQAKKIYEDLNGEVHQELPEFYHSRVKFYGDLFQSFFDADSVFHSECGKAASVAQDASYRLAKANEDVIYEPRSRKSMNIGSEENLTNGHEDNSHESPAPHTPTTLEATSTTPVATPRKSQLTNGPADADTTKDSTEDEAYEIQAFEMTKTNRESENISEADVHIYVNKVIEDSVEKTAAEAVAEAQTATGAEASVAVEKQEEVSQEKNEDEESDTDKVKSSHSVQRNVIVKSTACIVLRHDLVSRKLCENSDTSQCEESDGSSVLPSGNPETAPLSLPTFEMNNGCFYEPVVKLMEYKNGGHHFCTASGGGSDLDPQLQLRTPNHPGGQEEADNIYESRKQTSTVRLCEVTVCALDLGQTPVVCVLLQCSTHMEWSECSVGNGLYLRGCSCDNK